MALAVSSRAWVIGMAALGAVLCAGAPVVADEPDEEDAKPVILPPLEERPGQKGDTKTGFGDGPAFAAPRLEEFMSEDEIFLELVADPPIKAEDPKPNLETPPYTPPEDASGLVRDPAERVREMVPAHLYPHFDLYIYVNKAVHGLWAQQMFVYDRVETQPPADAVEAVDPAPVAETVARTETAPVLDQEAQDTLDLNLRWRWLVSTGREQRERYWTTTPIGLFRLDPHRFFARGWSTQYQVAMPWAMFFDYDYRTRKSGYAIHAAVPKYHNHLGRRASAGCIRLSLVHAEDLFKLISEGEYRAPVPEFPFDEEEGLTFRDGRVETDENGDTVMVDGYRVLLIIDDRIVEP